MPIDKIDHVALPIEKVAAMLSFYRALGFELKKVHDSMYTAICGDNKINFHFPELWKSDEFDLRGPNSLPGSGDLCFVWKGTIADVLSLLGNSNIDIITGPVTRTGGRNRGRDVGQSVYIRDPDKNLLEFIVYE